MIREAGQGEWEKVPWLHRDEGTEYMERARERNKIRFEKIPLGARIVLFAEQEKKVVGSIQLQLIDRNGQIADGKTVAHLDDLVVDPDCRLQGIGKQLLRAAEELLREKGFSQVTLFIRYGLRYEFLEQFYQKYAYELSFEKEDGSAAVFVKPLAF